MNIHMARLLTNPHVGHLSFAQRAWRTVTLLTHHTCDRLWSTILYHHLTVMKTMRNHTCTYHANSYFFSYSTSSCGSSSPDVFFHSHSVIRAQLKGYPLICLDMSLFFQFHLLAPPLLLSKRGINAIPWFVQKHSEIFQLHFSVQKFYEFSSLAKRTGFVKRNVTALNQMFD